MLVCLPDIDLLQDLFCSCVDRCGCDGAGCSQPESVRQHRYGFALIKLFVRFYYLKCLVLIFKVVLLLQGCRKVLGN